MNIEIPTPSIRAVYWTKTNGARSPYRYTVAEIAETFGLKPQQVPYLAAVEIEQWPACCRCRIRLSGAARKVTCTRSSLVRARHYIRYGTYCPSCYEIAAKAQEEEKRIEEDRRKRSGNRIAPATLQRKILHFLREQDIGIPISFNDVVKGTNEQVPEKWERRYKLFWGQFLGELNVMAEAGLIQLNLDERGYIRTVELTTVGYER